MSVSEPSGRPGPDAPFADRPAGTPLFSIVTITYQNEAGLKETVESVKAQSFRDFEHIVIDGGSKDGTADWLREHFAGAWVSEPDGGRYDAMGKGARMATGEYLWFLHAGDLLGDPGVLGRVAEGVAERPEWFYGLARVVSPEGVVQGTLGYVPYSRFTFLVLGNPLPHQACGIRRELFAEFGGYDDDFPISADQMLLARAAERSDPKAFADFLCDFDSTGISAGRAWWRNSLDGERIRRRLAGPTTRWRALDAAVSLVFALIRQVFHGGRRAAAAVRPG